MLTSSYDDGQARLVHTAVYGICVAKRSESRRASKLSVLLGGGGEHLGVAFYRPEEGGLAGEHSNSPSMAALQRASACERRLLTTTVVLRRWSCAWTMKFFHSCRYAAPWRASDRSSSRVARHHKAA